MELLQTSSRPSSIRTRQKADLSNLPGEQPPALRLHMNESAAMLSYLEDRSKKLRRIPRPRPSFRLRLMQPGLLKDFDIPSFSPPVAVI